MANNLIASLSLVEQTELLAAEMYRQLHERFSVSDSEAASVFYQLFMEEKGHAHSIRHCIKLVKDKTAELPSIQIDNNKILDLQRQIKNLTIRLADADLELILENLLELEITNDEFDRRLILAAQDDRLRSYLMALSSGDHTEKITRLAKNRGMFF